MAAEMDRAVRGTVEAQLAAGIDIGNDGEQQRVGFQTYIPARMSGFGGESKRKVGKDFQEVPELIEMFLRRFPRRAKISNAPQAIARGALSRHQGHRGRRSPASRPAPRRQARRSPRRSPPRRRPASSPPP